jgi:hypothetical protein
MTQKFKSGLITPTGLCRNRPATNWAYCAPSRGNKPIRIPEVLSRRRIRIALGLPIILALGTTAFLAHAQDKSAFPEGYDAVQAAPKSHKVIFENAIVRVLEVTVPPAGETEPMHHHRWPGFFLDWDNGGRSPHIRYHTPDGIKDVPSRVTPIHPGQWSVQWMAPEPMHAIETVEQFPQAEDIPLLRIEIKVR